MASRGVKVVLLLEWYGHCWEAGVGPIGSVSAAFLAGRLTSFSVASSLSARKTSNRRMKELVHLDLGCYPGILRYAC
jgi:hypothetical protein